MKITILTLFPEMFSPLRSSIIARAEKAGHCTIEILNIRDFSLDKHLKCDDEPYGGGAGMVMTPQPIASAIESVKTGSSHIVFTSPRGHVLSQEKVLQLSKKEHIIIVCGHYEGIDQRVIDVYANEEISIGDYVLTGGELPAMVIADSVLRYVPHVLKEGSVLEESFSQNLLEYPQYTRPEVFMDKKVPKVLLSGNHKEIYVWRKAESLKITKERRKDLLKDNHDEN